jgi:hypothetical protein
VIHVSNQLTPNSFEHPSAATNTAPREVVDRSHSGTSQLHVPAPALLGLSDVENDETTRQDTSSNEASARQIAVEISLSDFSARPAAVHVATQPSVDVRGHFVLATHEDSHAGATREIVPEHPSENSQFTDVPPALIADLIRRQISRTVRWHRSEMEVASPELPQEHLQRTSTISPAATASSSHTESSTDPIFPELPSDTIESSADAPESAPLMDPRQEFAPESDARGRITIDLNLPELGSVEIQIVEQSHDTAVSLQVDQQLHLLIREHLDEFVSALSASGIELAGLDVRQHGGNRNFEFESRVPWEELRPATNGNEESSPELARTGVVRYRMMSIMA